MGNELGAATALLFHAAMTETKSATVTSTGGLSLQGLWCYEFKTKKKAKPAAIKAARKAYLDAVKANGFKMGVKIRANQQLVTFSFAGKSGGDVVLTPVANVKSELDQAFGTDPSEQWVGLKASPGIERKATFPKPLHVCYKFTLEVTPVPKMPQPIPVVVTYGDESSKFALHYILSVVMLSNKEKSGTKGIQTSISAIF
jgi:hypothetical protein